MLRRSTKFKTLILSGLLLLVLLVVFVYAMRFSPLEYPVLRRSAKYGLTALLAVQLALGVPADGPPRTAFVESIYGGDHAAAVKLLLQHGANPEQEWASGEPDGPMLAWALRYRRVKVAKLLIVRGVALNQYRATFGGYSLLHMAAELGNAEVVRLMIAHGAKVNCRDNSGITPLQTAVMCGHTDIAALLLHAGAKGPTRRDAGLREHYVGQ